MKKKSQVEKIKEDAAKTWPWPVEEEALPIQVPWPFPGSFGNYQEKLQAEEDREKVNGADLPPITGSFGNKESLASLVASDTIVPDGVKTSNNYILDPDAWAQVWPKPRKNEVVHNWPELVPPGASDFEHSNFWYTRDRNGKRVGVEIGKKTTPYMEKDPNGKSMNDPGAKADHGKLRGWLCLSGFSHALERVAEVTTVGANKYTPNGWAQVPNGYDRYMDAFARHLFAYGEKKKRDDGPGGTGCEHMAQMIWNLLAAYELSIRTANSNHDE
jgi:hypothetical protein